MADAQLTDLKQYIAIIVSQANADSVSKSDLTNMATKCHVDSAIGGLKRHINKRFDEVLSAVGDTITAHNDGVDTQFKSYARRIIKLERQVA